MSAVTADVAPAAQGGAGDRLWRFTRYRSPAIVLAAVVLAVVVWWLVAVFVINDSTLLPTPASVLSRASTLLALSGGSDTMWGDIQASTVRVLLGWILGIAVGVPVGAAMATSLTLRSASDPFLQAGRAIPPLAFAPLLVVWLGIGETSKIFLLFLTVMPIIAINTTAGVTGVDQSYRRASLALGASKLYQLRRVIIPAVLPDIITSMRVTWGLAWGTLIAAELIASTQGVGYRILNASKFLDTDTIFVGITVIGLLAFFGDRVLLLFFRIAVPWRGRG